MLEIIQTILILVLLVLILRNAKSDSPSVAKSVGRTIILDTCALIDGRILDIVGAGFAPSNLVVPHFVLAELQFLADGNDSQKRERARFGLDAVKQLQANEDTNVILSDIDFEDIKTTDDKLIRLAQKLKADLCTTDYNLNKVASIQGVRVLNVNELSNAIRAVVLPGEKKTVAIVQKGSAKDQGVGYLDDGTMLVVAGASKLVGKSVKVEITRMLQSDAGKMLFAKLVEEQSNRRSNSRHTQKTPR